MHAKLEIVELLKSEFFDEILKNDAPDMIQAFGEHIGQLLITHAELEKSFKANNLWPDGRIKEDLGEGDEAREARMVH